MGLAGFQPAESFLNARRDARLPHRQDACATPITGQPPWVFDIAFCDVKLEITIGDLKRINHRRNQIIARSL
jgi:hypothetical protein